MSSQTTFGHHHQAFINVEPAGRIYGSGHTMPRLAIELKLRAPNERVQAEIHFLKLQVRFQNEVLAEGTAAGEFVDFHDRRLIVEAPITRAALQFINERLVGERVELELHLSGWMRIRYELADGESPYLGQPGPGDWMFTTFGVMSISALALAVPRSDWFKNVLEPIGTHHYVLTEIPLLKGGLGAQFEKSVQQLQQAERQYALGNDPSVFLHCKGAIEALPGWPKNIFDPLADKTKAEYLDDLVLKAKNYLDHGRHVAQSGEQEGEFPVDHREAAFALSLTKILLSETAAVVGAR